MKNTKLKKFKENLLKFIEKQDVSELEDKKIDEIVGMFVGPLLQKC